MVATISLFIGIALEYGTSFGQKLRHINPISPALAWLQTCFDNSKLRHPMLKLALLLLLLAIGMLIITALLSQLSIVIEAAISVVIFLFCLPTGLSLRPLDHPNPPYLWQTALYRLFGLLFWVALFNSPHLHLALVAATVYRLNAFLSYDSQWITLQQPAQQLQRYLDWLPSRLLALSFAFVGRFVAVIKCWLGDVISSSHHNASLLDNCALAAIKGELGSEEKEEINHAESSLLKRALVLWLIIIAILSLW